MAGLPTVKYTLQDIGYFEDLYGCDLATTEHEVCVDFAHYWLTQDQYVEWREECYGMPFHVARTEFEWLRRAHPLFQYIEGGERFFLIDVTLINALQTLADAPQCGYSAIARLIGYLQGYTSKL